MLGITCGQFPVWLVVPLCYHCFHLSVEWLFPECSLLELCLNMLLTELCDLYTPHSCPNQRLLTRLVCVYRCGVRLLTGAASNAQAELGRTGGEAAETVCDCYRVCSAIRCCYRVCVQ